MQNSSSLLKTPLFLQSLSLLDGGGDGDGDGYIYIYIPHMHTQVRFSLVKKKGDLVLFPLSECQSEPCPRERAISLSLSLSLSPSAPCFANWKTGLENTEVFPTASSLDACGCMRMHVDGAVHVNMECMDPTGGCM
jgi:hypothetical protein